MLALLVAVGACGPSEPAAKVHLSRTAPYASLRAMAKGASAVVEVAVDGPGVVQTVGNVPFTVTEVRVTEVLHGTIDDPVVRLRQLGSTQSGGGLVPEGELVKAGERYVAFVTPFAFADGRPTGQYVVVGAWQGLYRVEGTQLMATDRVASALPKRLSRTSLHTAIT